MLVFCYCFALFWFFVTGQSLKGIPGCYGIITELGRILLTSFGHQTLILINILWSGCLTVFMAGSDLTRPQLIMYYWILSKVWKVMYFYYQHIGVRFPSSFDFAHNKENTQKIKLLYTLNRKIKIVFSSVTCSILNWCFFFHLTDVLFNQIKQYILLNYDSQC